VSDAVSVLNAVDVESAHIVGLSMGGFCALHLTFAHPERVLSTVIGGVGYGSMPGTNEHFREECEAIANAFEEDGAANVARRYSVGPARVQFERKDQRGHAEFAAMLAEHSDVGSAGTMRGFQKERPSIYDFQVEMQAVDTPFLILVGDEDEGALEPSLMMKRQIPTSGLVVFPQTGHTINLEEPEAFNASVSNFIARAESGTWGRRDPRSLSASTTGMTD
jgi:pimeloyl-ACP methyl ester carboxylesterase